MQHPQLTEILNKVKQSLVNLYQDQLETIILYGSQARQDAKQFSDIDILVILKSNVNPYQEINHTSQIIAQICLDYDVVISRHFISLDKFKNSNTPFLYQIRKEGIVV
jgi:predicted nucleotidyltransferase